MSNMTHEDLSNVIDAYGGAFRGDWSNIDGRSVQSDMWSISAAILYPSTTTIEKLRSDLDLCPHGEYHWTDWCNSECGSTK